MFKLCAFSYQPRLMRKHDQAWRYHDVSCLDLGHICRCTATGLVTKTNTPRL